MCFYFFWGGNIRPPWMAQIIPRIIPNDPLDGTKLYSERTQINPWMTPNDLSDDPIWLLERPHMISWKTPYAFLQHTIRFLATHRMFTCNTPYVLLQHTIWHLGWHHMDSMESTTGFLLRQMIQNKCSPGQNMFPVSGGWGGQSSFDAYIHTRDTIRFRNPLPHVDRSADFVKYIWWKCLYTIKGALSAWYPEKSNREVTIGSRLILPLKN